MSGQKVGSLRAGGAGRNLTDAIGFLRYIGSGQTPVLHTLATAADVQAGEAGKLVPSDVLKQLLDGAGSARPSRMTENRAPLPSDNATVLGDDGRNLEVGSLWRHIKADPIQSEEDM